MTEYASNSHKSKREQNDIQPDKRAEKVIAGTAKVKKKSELRKFADVFVQEDIDSVKNYILLDVVVPAIKTAICDVVKNGIDMILYGEGGQVSSKKPTASKISYRAYYDNGRSPMDASYSRRDVYEYDDITVDSRGEAEEVLERMDDLMATYNKVRVADYYELLGVSSNYTANNYGWTDIRQAHVVRTRDGYMIKMPKAVPLD